jgi:hypothetical protein
VTTTRVLIGIGVWLLLIGLGVALWIGYHEVAWRLRQRRRRHVPVEFGGRRL